MQERLAELVRGIFPAACIIWTGAARLPRLKCRGRCRGCEVEMSSVTQPISSGGCEASPSLACHCLAQAPSALARGSVVMRRPPQASSAAAQRDNGRSAWRCAWRAGRGRRLPCAQVFAPRRRNRRSLRAVQQSLGGVSGVVNQRHRSRPKAARRNWWHGWSAQEWSD
jgi:hypothetical protein